MKGSKIMVMIDYYLYLTQLPKEEMEKEIIILLVFWGVMLLIGAICEYIKNVNKFKIMLT